MTDNFDPYRKWLGIPPKDQPPHHYRLLNIELYEKDPDVISNAVDARISHVKQYASGEHAEAAKKILDEIAEAKVHLLNAEKKAAYDEKLRSKQPKRKPAIRTAVPLSDEADSAGQGLEAVPTFGTSSPTSRVSGRSRRGKKQPAAILVIGIAMVVVLSVAVGAFLLTQDKGKHTTRRSGPTQPATDSTPAQPAGPAPDNKELDLDQA